MQGRLTTFAVLCSLGIGTSPGCSSSAAPDPGSTVDAGDPPGSPDAAPVTADAAPGAADAAPTGDDYVVPPAATCNPTGDACALPAPVTTIAASYRKDAYLPEDVYVEYPDPPVDGGRVHIAAVAAVSGQVTRVLIDGIDADTIYDEDPSATPPFEWYHVWPRELVAGEPVWVAFHSRAAVWDSRASATITIETTAGDAVAGSFPVAQTPVPITYVTVSPDRTAVLVHLRNTSASPQTVRGLILNGRDVTGVACIADPSLAPGEASLLTIPLCTPAPPGAAWTIVASLDNAPAAVGVGRVVPPRFPIGAWQNTDECPFPSANAANYDRMRDAGFDTMYFHGGVCQPSTCGCDGFQLLNQQLPALPDWYALANAGDLLSYTTPLPDTSAVIGAMTGDESDGTIYDEDTGVPVAAGKARRSLRMWQRHPEIPTFNGGKTNKHIGSFAGMADVQGMDLYVAACAPHITQFGSHPPLRGAYDYLRNTRDNHMPGPTWLWTQGLHSGWNQDTLGGQRIHVQPDPQEILIQAMSAIAAGAKGLLWFQISDEEAAHAPARWQAIADANRVVRAVREQLRAGDPTGMVSFDTGSLAEAIRGPRAIVVPIINLTAGTAVDDIACGAGFLAGNFPHWQLDAHDASVTVTVPDDFGVVDVFEVSASGVSAAPAYTVSGRQLAFGAVNLDNTTPVRMLVLAGDAQLRGDISSAL